MPHALELERVAPGIFLWRYYDAAIKTELFATGLETESGTFLIDPIGLASEAMTEFTRVAGIIVTNDNHWRAAAQFAQRLHVPIWADVTVATGLTGATPIGPDSGVSGLAPGLIAISVEGAAAGEIAIYREAEKGTMVMGD